MADLNKLVSGYRDFYEKYFKSDKTVYKKLSTGQSPKTLVIACSDSRVDPAILMNADPGDLFVIRNVANIVPPCQVDDSLHGVSAALEFAVRVLKVENIIILGHSGCAGVNALIHPEKVENSDFISNWIEVAKPAKNRMMMKVEGGEITKDHEHSCEREVIVLSLNNLLSFPWIVDSIEKSNLKIYGWYFDVVNGKITQYDANTNEFEAV